MKTKKVRGEDSILTDTALGEASFKIEDLGAVTRMTYNGTFKVRVVLEPFRLLNSGRQLRALLGPYSNQAPDHELNLAFALSQLEQRIIEAPPWWDTNAVDVRGSGVKDRNIIMAVFDLATRAEEKYQKEVENETKAHYERLKTKLEEMKTKMSGSEKKEKAE